MKRLLIDYNPYCVRVALEQDGALIDFAVERAAVRGLVGNIYKGKVENVLSGMKAAFVNIGLERNGFLYVGESLVDCGRLFDKLEPASVKVSAGDVIMCQVVKDQFGQKGARLTTDVTLPGNFLVLLPTSAFLGVSRKIEDEKRRHYLEELVKSVCPENMGFIIRSAADKAEDEDIKADAAELISLWEKIRADYCKTGEKSLVFEEASILERTIRDSLCDEVDCVAVNDASVAKQLEGKVGGARIELYHGDRNIMKSFGVSEQINHIADRRVDLENGAYIVIDKAEALTVIDVNTGRFVGSKDLEDTVFKTNMAAARGIARQLRLRNLSGIVVIDFIDMQTEAHRNEVLECLKAELKKDRLKTAVVSMTELGLVELTRKKTRLPVDSFMLQPCKDCMGGFVISDEQLLFLLRDELIEFYLKNKSEAMIARVHPDVFEKLFDSHIMERECATLWKGLKIYVVGDASLKRDVFDICTLNAKNGSVPPYARLMPCAGIRWY
jgi:ribonuclease G